MIRDNTFWNRRSVNLDLTHRCAIECPNCPRQFIYRNKGLKVPGQDLSDSNFEKIVNFGILENGEIFLQTTKTEVSLL